MWKRCQFRAEHGRQTAHVRVQRGGDVRLHRPPLVTECDAAQHGHERRLLHWCAQVVGVEATHSAIVSEHHALLVATCRRVRQVQGFEHSVLVFAFESNLGFEAQHLTRAIVGSNIKDWHMMLEGPRGTLGWHTTNVSKEKSCLTTRSALEGRKMWLCRDFFSTTLGVTQARNRIRDELSRFAIITAVPKTPFAEPKRTYSGKVGGMQDDLAVTLQIALEACVVFHRSEKYTVVARGY